MFAYLEGLPEGSELEKLVKNYKIVIKSFQNINNFIPNLYLCLFQLLKYSF